VPHVFAAAKINESINQVINQSMLMYQFVSSSLSFWSSVVVINDIIYFQFLFPTPAACVSLIRVKGL
jgi:hypothetical protein